MQSFSSDPVAASSDYRRRARRIRASFAGNSFLIQRGLQDLAQQQDSQTSTTANSQNSDRARRCNLSGEMSAVVERGFAEHAQTKLQSFGFTFSDRVALLNAGEKLGLTRFRANLILAMQENQVPRNITVTRSVVPRSLTFPLLLILGTELGIVAVVAWLAIAS